MSAMIEQAINVRRSGGTVNFIDLMVSSGLSAGQQALWATKWAEARDKDPIENIVEYTKQLRKDAALREVQDVLTTTNSYVKNSPQDVLVWLPTAIQTLRSIQTTGQRYDPTPSVIWRDGYVPKVVAKFHKSPTLNEMFGGGLSDGCLMLYGTPTSQGKSTFAYYVIAHAVASGHKAVLFSREASGPEATARIVQVYGGFTRGEVENKQGSTPERQQALGRSLRELDRYLTIYDRHSAALGDFREVIHWERPMLAVVDHIGLYGADNPRAGLQIMGKHDPVGALSEILLDVTREEHLTILATSQFSSSEQKNLHQFHDLNPPTYYGSGRVLMSADLGYIAQRYWLPTTRDGRTIRLQHNRCKKDRVEGSLVDHVWYLEYIPQWRTYGEYTQASPSN